jgi:hypothetical protein
MKVSPGAVDFVDYRQTALDRVLSDIDVQLDTVGPAVQDRCWNVMKKGGVV